MGYAQTLPTGSKTHPILQCIWNLMIMSGRFSHHVIRTSLISVILVTVLFLVVYSVVFVTFDDPIMVNSNMEADQQKFYHQVAHRRIFKSRYYEPEENAQNHRRTETLWNYHQQMNAVSIQPKCNNASVMAVITSAPYHEVQRKAIRDTWCSLCNGQQGSKGLHCQCVFLIGQTGDAHIQAQIHTEIEQHHDILLGDYLDTYRNLSLKVLTGLHWFAHQCKTQYLLKTDDDCFTNTPVFLDFVSIQTSTPSNLYVGNVFSTDKDTKVIRESTSKWSLAKDDYAPNNYPPYASGTGYILSRDVVLKILETSRLFKPFPNEDVYVGVLADYVGVAPIHSYRFTLISHKWNLCNFRYLLVIHHVSTAQQREMFDMAHRAAIECSDKNLLRSWS